MTAAHLDTLPRIPAAGPDEITWTPIRHALGIGAFGVNAWHADAGGLVIEEHDEIPEPGVDEFEPHEELYLVLSGSARFTIDGTEVDAGAGTLLALAPERRRGAVATADGTTVLAVGAPRGEAFRPSAWERRAVQQAGLG